MWFIIDINKNNIKYEKIRPHLLSTLLKVPESISFGTIENIKKLVLEKKVIPVNGVLVFKHNNSYLAYCESEEKYLNFVSNE